MGLADKVREWRALRKWSRSTIGKALDMHAQKYLTESVLGHLPLEDYKSEAANFLDHVFALAQAENPLLDFREALAGVARAYSFLQVLCLKPEKCADDDVFTSRYISGELYKYVRSLSPHNEEIEKTIWQHPDISDENLVFFLNVRTALHSYYLNGYNIVRGEFEPRNFNDPKDWFKPMVKSALISAEDYYRSILHLPRLCPDGILALQHSTFVDMVAKGYEQPLFEWERYYGLIHSEAV
jgi:hypothetical protein